MVFKDRESAAIILAEKISALKIEPTNLLVLGLPRGGVITAKIVARTLKAELDIVVCRKLGAPNQNELGFGAIAAGGIMLLNESLVKSMGLKQETIEAVAETERRELARRIQKYRGSIKYPNITGHDIVIVDDGIATGITIKAAVEFVRNHRPKTIIVASPVCAQEASDELKIIVDKTILLLEPKDFYAVGQFYQEFPQVTDNEVISALKKTT